MTIARSIRRPLGILLAALTLSAAAASAATGGQATRDHVLIHKSEGEAPVVSCRLASRWSVQELSVLLDEPFRIDRSAAECRTPGTGPLFALEPRNEPAPGVAAPPEAPNIATYCDCDYAFLEGLQARFAPIHRRKQVAEELVPQVALKARPRRDDLFWFRQISPGAEIVGTDGKGEG